MSDLTQEPSKSEQSREAGRSAETGRFLPGNRLSPGRPKVATAARAARQILSDINPDDPAGRTYAECIVESLAKKAIKGDVRAAAELINRAEGQPKQSIDLTADAHRQKFEMMTSAELGEYALSGRLPEWFHDPLPSAQPAAIKALPPSPSPAPPSDGEIIDGEIV